MGGAPADLLTYRKQLFAATSHDYQRQRAVADQVPESTLSLTPARARERIADWRSLLGLPPRTG